MNRKTVYNLVYSLLGFFLLVGLTNAQIDFEPAANIIVGDKPDTVALGDLDADGDLDMAVTSDNPTKVSVLFNQGDGTFGTPTEILLKDGSGIQYIVAGDLNGDDTLDLAVSLRNSNAVQVLLNKGDGSFSEDSTWAVGLEPRDLAAGDLDSDGDLDLVTSNRNSGNVSVLLNKGPAIFEAAVHYPAGQDPRGVALADFSGDHFLDIAVSVHDPREIIILTNLADGTFIPGATLSVGSQLRPEGVIAKDLNGDGHMDIAASTSGNSLNFASVFRNNGSGIFIGPAHYAVGGVEPSGIVSADFNLDGHPDLATVNTASNDVSALPGDGQGGFETSIQFNVGTAPGHLIAGDLDGNGSKDLVTVNRDTQDVSVLINLDSGWLDLGYGLSGTHGVPSLTGTGALESGSLVSLSMSGALENSLALIAIGMSRIDYPFMGGIFVPSPDLFAIVPTGPAGSLNLSGFWPGGFPNGISFFFQVWIEDPAAVQGYSATNALEGVTQ